MHRLGGMTWVAIHQLAEALCKLLLATRVGDILDRVNRSKGWLEAGGKTRDSQEYNAYWHVTTFASRYLRFASI